MGVDDRTIKTLRELQKLTSPLRDFERLYGRGFQRAIREQRQIEAMLKPSLPATSVASQQALESMQVAATLAQKLKFHSSAAANLIQANRCLADQLRSFSQQSEVQRAAKGLGKSWEHAVSLYTGLQAPTGARELALQAHYTSVAETTMLAQRRLLSVRWDLVGSTAALQRAELLSARDRFTTLTGAYRSLIDSLRERSDFIASLPPIVSGAPPIEILTSVGVLNSISGQLEDDGSSEADDAAEDDIRAEVVESLDELLSKLDPSLKSMWLGAKDSLRSKNPDHGRHVLFSLRELVSHVLQLVAPTSAVEVWTNDASYYHEGRPTRRARILFVCREINYDPFTKFLEADVKAGIELIALFQKGHQMSVPFTDAQLGVLVTRTEALLRLLLLVSGGAK